MSAQDVILGSRVAHVRELKAEVADLRTRLDELRIRHEALVAHFDLALLAAMELRDGGTVEFWDGWNLILGSKREARDRDELLSIAKASGRRIWIVYDGADEKSSDDGQVRVSYTGGTGAHRADRFICDFVRMAAYLGLSGRVEVRTNDLGFRRQVERLAGISGTAHRGSPQPQ